MAFNRLILFFLFLLLSTSCKAEWVQIQPISKNNYSGFLKDIDEQVEENLKHYYRNEDLVTCGHELTHAVNARIRNQFKTKNGYYLLKNRCFIISNPDFTLKHVADAVPSDKRGRVYQLYLVQQQTPYKQGWGHWNETPLYVLDEFVAYINGTLVGIEHKMRDRSLYSFDNALEMFEYSKAAQELCRKSKFKEQKELDDFMDWCYINRIQFIKTQFKELGWNP